MSFGRTGKNRACRPNGTELKFGLWWGGQGGRKPSVRVASAALHGEALPVTMIKLGGDTQRLQKTHCCRSRRNFVSQVRSVTGRSRRRLGSHWFLVTGHWRRGSNFVIFPAPKLGTGHSRVTISFRRCPSAAQRSRALRPAAFWLPNSSPVTIPSRLATWGQDRPLECRVQT